jgi:hypothetical protein
LTAAAQLEADQSLAHLGTSVASAGDVNGDGYSDVIVGAEHYDSGEPQEGAAFVFLGGAAGIDGGNPAAAAARLEGDQNGAPLYGAGELDEGAAFVFLGSVSGIASGGPASAAAQLEADQVSANLGRSVSAQSWASPMATRRPPRRRSRRTRRTHSWERAWRRRAT